MGGAKGLPDTLLELFHRHYSDSWCQSGYPLPSGKSARGEAPAARQHFPYRIKLPCSEDSYPMAGMKVLSVQGFNLGTKLALFLAVLQNPGKQTDADA